MNADQPAAGAREWIGLAVLVLPAVLVSMDMSVLFMALPFISADLRPGSSEMLWMLDIYGFLLAGLLITMGSLGDRIGRRRLLLIGAAMFGLASILAAYSTSAAMLIAARALLGAGGATLAPSTLSLLRNMFHVPRQRSVAIGVWTAGFAGGAVLGPIVGGLLLEHFWWGSVFLLNVPVMVLLLALAPVLLPEFKDPKPGRFDLTSAVLSLAAVLPVIYGIKTSAEHGFGWPAALSITAGLAMGGLFVRRQRRPDPLIDIGLFAERPFSASVLANLLTMFAMLGALLFTAQYLQLVLGMRPFTAALWSLPAFAGMPVGIALATMFVRWVRPGVVVGGGLATAAVGLLLLTRIGVDSGLGAMLVAAVVMVVGLGAVTALANDLIITTAPAERAGSASAVSETGAEFGGALGMAILGSIGWGVYGGQVADNAPRGLPGEALEAARDTLGAAAEVSGRLPEALGAPLLRVANEAYVYGMQVTAVVGAAIMAAAAVVVTILLRRVRGNAPAKPAAEPAAR